MRPSLAGSARARTMRGDNLVSPLCHHAGTMNRTDRLYALAEELRRVGPAGTTSARLARLFEVSPRTVKRDVATLQQAGLPVAAQAGLGGGYVLAASVGLPPVNFTPGQAVALALAVRALPPGSPFGADADAARAKVLDALPPAARARADALAARVWSRSAPAGGPPATVLRAVEEALDRSLVVAIEYASADGTVSRRRSSRSCSRAPAASGSSSPGAGCATTCAGSASTASCAPT